MPSQSDVPDLIFLKSVQESFHEVQEMMRAAKGQKYAVMINLQLESKPGMGMGRDCQSQGF